FTPVDAVRSAEGTLTIYQLPTQERFLRIEADFRSSRAPNIHIILTRNPDPMDERGVGFDYIEIGELHANVGAQVYDLPPTVDFSRYPILALYSPEYDAVLATATIALN
ncbi:MAG: DM13 domain-containing protein, partial [Anaerolineae bacterium]|nr:DM13 domain-containing protein [Anaerolineae bacterium]